MSYQLKGMFSSDFFGDIYENQITDKPQNIADAIASIHPITRQEIAKELFNMPNDNFLSDEMILEKILITDTVRNINTPVEVYIDTEGYYSILVY